MEPCGKIPAASERWSPMAAGLAKRPVERHKGGDGGEDGEQTVENNSGGDREQTVLAGLLVCAPEDVLPALPGDLPRRLCVSAAAWLLARAVLHDVGSSLLRDVPKAPVAVGGRATLFHVR